MECTLGRKLNPMGGLSRASLQRPHVRIMSEASRERPVRAVVLHEFQAHIRARPKPIFDAIAERFHPGEEARSLYTADSSAWLVIVQGGHWYRAEYRVIPDDVGSTVEHALVSVATNPKRLGRRSSRRVIEAAPAEFDRLMSSLRAELE